MEEKQENLEDLVKQLKSLEIFNDDTAYSLRFHLRHDQGAFNFRVALTINGEPVTGIPFFVKNSEGVYRLDRYDLARIEIPDIQVGDVRAKELESQMRLVNWNLPMQELTKPQKEQQEGLWRQYWSMTGTGAGEAVQAALYLKYWKGTGLDEANPKPGLFEQDYETVQCFPVNNKLSFTIVEAHNLLNGRFVGKTLADSGGLEAQRWFVLSPDTSAYRSATTLFQLAEHHEYNLAKALDAVALVENQDPEKKAGIAGLLGRGNIVAGSLDDRGTVETVYLKADPVHKSLMLYDRGMRPLEKNDLVQPRPTTEVEGYHLFRLNQDHHPEKWLVMDNYHKALVALKINMREALAGVYPYLYDQVIMVGKLPGIAPAFDQEGQLLKESGLLVATLNNLQTAKPAIERFILEGEVASTRENEDRALLPNAPLAYRYDADNNRLLLSPYERVQLSARLDQTKKEQRRENMDGAPEQGRVKGPGRHR